MVKLDSEYSFSDLEPEICILATKFMQSLKLCSGQSIFIFNGNAWVFFTGIPYGFMGSTKILNREKQPRQFRDACENRYSKHIIDENSFSGLFLKRFYDLLDGKIQVNILQLLVPECFPPMVYDI